MMNNACKRLALASSKIAIAPQRGFAAPAASDPVQKLFVEKLREYKTKSAKSPGFLLNSSETIKAQLNDEMMRVKRNFGVADGEETKVTSKFSEGDFKLDSINMKDWK